MNAPLIKFRGVFYLFLTFKYLKTNTMKKLIFIIVIISIISISCEKEDDTNSSPSTPSEPRY